MKNLTIYAAGCFRFVISKLCTEFAEQRKSEVAPEFCVGGWLIELLPGKMQALS